MQEKQFRSDYFDILFKYLKQLKLKQTDLTTVAFTCERFQNTVSLLQKAFAYTRQVHNCNEEAARFWFCFSVDLGQLPHFIIWRGSYEAKNECDGRNEVMRCRILLLA